MDGYDAITMPYLGNPMTVLPPNMPNSEYLSMSQLDGHEQPSNFDPDNFVSSDDMIYSAHGIIRNIPQNFPEQYADIMASFEAPAPEQQQQQQQDSNIDHNHKLLSFSVPSYSYTLLDYALHRTNISVAAQLHGMFFLAESPWTNSPTDTVPPQVAELTCYRRNLFQITGSVTLPRTLRYLMTDQGDRIPILALELTVSATESVEGNAVKIISVPWKTPAANGNQQPEDKTEKEPPAIPLDTMAGQDMDSDYASFPIAWKRLQFRIATANNGRRKELQQHFVVRLKVMATLSTGAKVPVCEVRSGPVIVRGRSPRNFQSRKDLPLSGSAASSRKNTQASTAKNNNRSPRQPSQTPVQSTPQLRVSTKSSTPEMGSIFQFEEAPLPQVTMPPQSSPPYTDWTQMPPATTSSGAPPLSFPPATVPPLNGALPGYQHTSPTMSRDTDSQRRSSVAPIPLSLVDEEFSPPKSADVTKHSRPNKVNNALPQKNPSPEIESARPTKMRKTSQVSPTRSRPNRSASNGVPVLSATTVNAAPAFPAPASTLATGFSFPSDSADLLYEYFPLGLDEWHAPVDAVYRPHVVHHTNIPADPKVTAARNRSKRYFAAEDVY
ncbi:NDT80 / PhoG like DNA-binding family protein [Paecilomyces variotii No. 5]|uniref:NDT80 / PhoG like DNA-binding family protein n=1 Tax=Byssochlamys spectabilis (strain No. 5 / NBRC 109023) TaxID=1356009 RepID=V5FYN1_BYSSN|nr:NDT80 / PhoG like DNA-binding family protein [Paecilomyces variotii No. 5]